jgi:hypothetical protein
MFDQTPLSIGCIACQPILAMIIFRAYMISLKMHTSAPFKAEMKELNKYDPRQ